VRGVLAVLVAVAWADEARSQAATFTVNSADDVDDGTCDATHCSLREAINAASGTGGLIAFAISGTGPHTIQPNSALPTPWTVVVDGYTQPGAIPNTNPPNMGTNAVLMIELDGTNAGSGVNGLNINASGSTVRGLVINRFAGAGIRLGSSGNVVEGNFLGTDVAGATALGNDVGVEVAGPNNTIGGNTPSARNLISGQFRGIKGGATGTVVQGNLIGTDAAGTSALTLGNTNGIRFDGASNTVIGGTAAAERNVISGNGFGVVLLGGGVSNNVVQGNYIGTDVTGAVVVGNSFDGVLAGDGTIIGGTVDGAGNVISGNGWNGLSISGTGALIRGNLIGTDASGTTALGNGSNGIGITGTNHSIGGTTTGAGNVISDNAIGIVIGGTQVRVEGNFIGTDVTGMGALGNGFGIEVRGSDNTIGGTTGARNVISASGADGIQVLGTTSGNVVRGNYIGADAAGQPTLGNGRDGIRLESSSGNTVGGLVTGAGNLVVGNNGAGVSFSSSSAVDNLVEGNTITANGAGGVVSILSGSRNAILSNSIFDNGGLGIDLESDGVTANDAGDGDVAPNGNELQNFPVLTSVMRGSTLIEASLNSAPNSVFRVQFFSNATCDPTDHGEGEFFLGDTLVVTDGAGDNSFGLPLPTAPGGHQVVTATATDASGTTSEFSECAGFVPGFALEVFTDSSQVVRGWSRDYTVRVRAVGGSHDDPVSLSCTDLPAQAACSFDPAAVTPGASEATSILTVSTANPGTPAGPATFTVVGTSASFDASTMTTIDVIVDFDVAVAPSSVTIARGEAATYTVSVDDVGGFSDAISLSCSGLPNLASCAFSPASVTLSGADATSTLTVSTTAAGAVPLPPVFRSPREPMVFGLVAVAGLLILGLLGLARYSSRATRRPLQVAWVLPALAVVLALAFSACGDDGGGPTGPPGGQAGQGTPTGTFNVTVAGTAGSVTHSETVMLVVQ
jgi:CSLREA domain-containing protein